MGTQQSKVLDDLKADMLLNGYSIDKPLKIGKDRFEIAGYKGTPGSYKIRKSASGIIATYGDFVSRKWYKWSSAGGKNSEKLTPEQRAERKKQLDREADELAAEVQREREKGAMSAKFFWQFGKNAKSHPYLEAKGVKSYGLKICTMGGYDGWLMVLGYDQGGDLRTVNYIRSDGEKHFEKDVPKKGAFFEIEGDGDKIIIAEGYATAATIREATGHTVIVAYDAGNLGPVAKSIRGKYKDAEIIIAADNDQWKPELGNGGIEAARDAAIAINAKIAIPAFKRTETKPTDFNDLGALEGPDAVKGQIGAAAEIDRAEALKAELKTILSFDLLKQEMEIDRLTKKYGVRKYAIDQHLRKEAGAGNNENKIVEQIEPAREPVDGKELLDAILSEICERVILPEGAAETVSLWIMLTYCYDAFDILPMLGITSPTKRCGKTTTLEVLQAFVCRALPASNITAAAVYRTIELCRPTMLIDEADTFLKNKNNPDLAGVINSGHTRSFAFAVRVEGDNHEPKRYSTWAPKAIGMIGTLPPTINDRSIVIQLSRKTPGERIKKTGMRFINQCTRIRSMCHRWADDNTERLLACCAARPSSDNDRADDNWAPLFAIANVIGGDWPEKAKTARSLIDKSSEEDATATALLSDIRDTFEEQAAERIFSSDLIEKLNGLSDSRWCDWNKGRGLSANQLSRLLKPFGVTPKTMRIGDDRFKGYTLKSFQDAFDRYLPRDRSVTPCQFNDFNNLDENQNVTPDYDVTNKKHDNQLNLFDCHDVTDKNTPRGAKTQKTGFNGSEPQQWDEGII